jgi:hypothetical protein
MAVPDDDLSQRHRLPADRSSAAVLTGGRRAALVVPALSSIAMSTPPDLTRKVRQLDNDVQSIYELLTGISATQRRQGNRLEEIAIAQGDQGAKLNEILDLLRDRRDERPDSAT